MPNRLIRDGLLESEAVLSLPLEGRWLYIAVLLSADDVGFFEATPFKLARRADIRREQVDKLLAMLADADLVRLYQVDGRNYGFVTRFRQRIQIKRVKHPLPPLALLAGDEDALNKIRDLASKTTVGQPLSTVAQPSEPEPEPLKEKTCRPAASVVVTSMPEPQGFLEFWKVWPASKRKGSRAQCLALWGKAKLEAISDHIIAHVEAMTGSDDWTKEHGAYIPAPLVYLRQSRWDGAEVEAPRSNLWAGAI